MSIKVKDADGVDIYLKGTGVGSVGDPFVSDVGLLQPLSVITAISGQVTGTFAGTEQQGSNVPLTNGVYIKALAGNTGVVYVGNDGAGAVSASDGFQLDRGDMIILQVSNLNQLWFDVVTSGDKFCWLKA
jgi:hypothetical protein